MHSQRLHICPYSGKQFPRNEMNWEHIVPRALEGPTSKGSIPVSRSRNSNLGSVVDGRLAGELSFKFARAKFRTKSAKGKQAKVRINVAPASKVNFERFEEEFKPTHKFEHFLNGTNQIVELSSQQEVYHAFGKDAFVYRHFIEDVARMKFLIKCLLGINRLYFLDKLDEHIDVSMLQQMLFQDLAVTPIPDDIEVPIRFSHPLMLNIPDAERQSIDKLASVFADDKTPKLLLQEHKAEIVFSAFVLGVMVGSMQLPTNSRVLHSTSEGFSLLFRQRGRHFKPISIDNNVLMI